MKCGLVGGWMASVEDGKTTLARGWGPRKLGETAPVDAETLFQTGSTGQAMTVAALAILVDQGRIAWDDPVLQHMPWFRMYDPLVTREMTNRDLLVQVRTSVVQGKSVSVRVDLRWPRHTKKKK